MADRPIEFERMLATHADASTIRALVDKHGAAYVIGIALGYAERKERLAHEAYRKERDELFKSFEAAAKATRAPTEKGAAS